MVFGQARKIITGANRWLCHPETCVFRVDAPMRLLCSSKWWVEKWSYHVWWQPLTSWFSSICCEDSNQKKVTLTYSQNGSIFATDLSISHDRSRGRWYTLPAWIVDLYGFMFSCMNGSTSPGWLHLPLKKWRVASVCIASPPHRRRLLVASDELRVPALWRPFFLVDLRTVAKSIDDWRVRTHFLNFWSKSQSQSSKFSYSTIYTGPWESKIPVFCFCKTQYNPPNTNLTFIQGLARFDALTFHWNTGCFIRILIMDLL